MNAGKGIWVHACAICFCYGLLFLDAALGYLLFQDGERIEIGGLNAMRIALTVCAALLLTIYVWFFTRIAANRTSIFCLNGLGGACFFYAGMSYALIPQYKGNAVGVLFLFFAGLGFFGWGGSFQFRRALRR